MSSVRSSSPVPTPADLTDPNLATAEVARLKRRIALAHEQLAEATNSQPKKAT